MKRLSEEFYSKERIAELNRERWMVGVPNLAGGYDLIEYYPTKREAREVASAIRKHKGVTVRVQDMFNDDGSYCGE